MKIVIVIFVLIALAFSSAMAQGNRDLWSQENYIQSAKIHYQHVYKKTKLREDLYHCITLLRDAIDRFGHRPELYYMVGTFYAEINAIDTMVAYFDSTKSFCDDQSIEEKYRNNCYKKDKYVEKMGKTRQEAWEKAYNDGVEFLSQYDTIVSWIENAPTEDSAKALDSLKKVAFEFAQRDFETALLAKPEDPRTYDGLAVLLEREKRHQEAVDLYKRAIEMMGENPDLVSKIAYAYIYIPDWEKAIEWFQKYLTYEPEDVNALINLSVAYNAVDDYEKWHEYTTRVLELQPENTQFLFNAGQYWFMKMQEAADSLSAVTDSAPDAKAQRAAYDARIIECRQNAEKDFEAIVKIDPQDTDALKRLGIIYLLNQQNEKAVNVLEQYIEIDSTDNDVLDFLGRGYINLGALMDAIRPYELLLENDPGNITAWERLADLYEINKMPDKAEEAKARAQELKNL